MPTHQHIDDLSADLSSSAMAQTMVRATSRFIAGRELGDEDKQAVRRSKQLFLALASPDAGLPRSGERLRQLTTREGAVDALAAARAQAPSEDAQEHLKSLSKALDGILKGKRTEDVVRDAENIQQLFRQVGRLTLARSSSRLRARQDRFSWLKLTSTPTSPSLSQALGDHSTSSAKPFRR